MTQIVWAEDSSTDQVLIQSVLDQMDPPVNVAFADDGEAAVQLALQHRPALIVLDLKMPRVDGLEALRRLRKASGTSSSAIIVFSSTSQPQEVDAIRSLGASGFIQKPIDYEGFTVAVRTIARKANVLAEQLDRPVTVRNTHHVLFAESERTMLDAGLRYLREAERAGRGRIVVAVRGLVHRLRADLGDSDIVWIVAEEAKERVYRDGVFDIALFQAMADEASHRASKGGQRPISWFGQLVDHLHMNGQGDDALCIEAFIQRIALDAPDQLDILCAYSFDAMTPSERHAAAVLHTDAW